MKKKSSKSNFSEKSEEKELNTAIESVYRKYGTDLRAFTRDVYRDLEVKRQESPSRRVSERH
jgi:hypothetical protein